MVGPGSDCNRISGLFRRAILAPGHDGGPARGANRSTRPQGPRKYSASPRAGQSRCAIKSFSPAQVERSGDFVSGRRCRDDEVPLNHLAHVDPPSTERCTYWPIPTMISLIPPAQLISLAPPGSDGRPVSGRGRSGRRTHIGRKRPRLTPKNREADTILDIGYRAVVEARSERGRDRTKKV